MNEALPNHPTRRSFINWFLGTSAGAFLASVAYPVARCLVPPTVGESTAAPVTLPIKPDELKDRNVDVMVKYTSATGESPAPLRPSLSPRPERVGAGGPQPTCPRSRRGAAVRRQGLVHVPLVRLPLDGAVVPG